MPKKSVIDEMYYFTVLSQCFSPNPNGALNQNLYPLGSNRQPEKFSKKSKQQFLRDQGSKFKKAWLSYTSSNEAIKDTK